MLRLAVFPPKNWLILPLSRLVRGALVCGVLLSSAASCAPKPAANPRATVDAYVDALKKGDTEGAYALLSVATRGELSLADFQALVRDNPEEIKQLLKQLSEESSPPLVQAIVTTKQGDRLILTYEDGAWRIDASAIDLYSQAEPRQTLSSFVRAYDHGRFDVLLRFVPKSQSEGLSEAVLKSAWQGEQKVEMEQIVESLRANIGSSELEVLGDRATMSYGAGGVVQLLREDGVWKIEDLK